MYGCNDENEYQENSRKFDDALKEAQIINSSLYAQEIMSLFCDDEDYGTLESCFRVLSNIDKIQLKQAFEASKIELQKRSVFWYNEILSLIE
jgi:hypothetical protein